MLCVELRCRPEPAQAICSIQSNGFSAGKDYNIDISQRMTQRFLAERCVQSGIADLVQTRNGTASASDPAAFKMAALAFNAVLVSLLSHTIVTRE